MDRQELRPWRRRRGLTQRQLAALLGVSQSMLSQIERGVRPLPTKTRPISLDLPPETDEPSVADHLEELRALSDEELYAMAEDAPRGPYSGTE